MTATAFSISETRKWRLLADGWRGSKALLVTQSVMKMSSPMPLQPSDTGGRGGGERDVCVVVPTYNRPQLVQLTLKSLLAQTVRPRQIVVVNEGPDPETAAVLDHYGELLTIVVKARGGVQSARNAGAALAQTAWIAMLDDDDLYQPDFLEVLGEVLSDKRVDLIFADHRKFKSAKAFGRTNFEMAPRDFWEGIPGHGANHLWSFVGAFPLERILRFNPFYPSTMIIRRSFFEALGGYDPRVAGNPTEDLEFLVRALSAGQLAIVWRPLVDYRVHAENISGGARRQKVGRWRIFEFVERCSNGVSASFKKRLAEDLPKRRRAIFDLAFQSADFDLLREVEPLLDTHDWSIVRRLKRSIGRMPRPAARSFSRLVSLPKTSLETARHWSRVARGIKS